MPIDKSTREIINILLPNMDDENERKALVETALFGCDILHQITWHGPAFAFTSQLVRKLLTFGECESGKLAVVNLLEELRGFVGHDRQVKIDAMIGQIIREQSAPEGDTAGEPILAQEPITIPITKKLKDDLYVFISYARPDERIAQHVEDYLKAARVRVFRDTNNMTGGADWDITIEEALRRADRMVLLLSNASMPYQKEVHREWFFFDQHDKPIHPLYLEKCELHSRMYIYDYIDVRNNLEEGLQRLLKELSTEFTPLMQSDEIKERSDQTGVRQVWVSSGCFLMGSNLQIDHDAEEDEFPRHEVCISHGFWLDIYPVTNAAYQQFIEDGGYRKEKLWVPKGWAWLQEYEILGPRSTRNFTDLQQPRVGVSWYEADAYARWRGGRLPSEAEWEYVARGPESLTYPWGNDYDAKRLNVEKHEGITTVVGKYEGGKSWVGAYDMAGNVLEWVADWYSAEFYRQGISKDPKGPDVGWTRVLRGGSWRNRSTMARAANRYDRNPEFRHNNIGFRVVCDG